MRSEIYICLTYFICFILQYFFLRIDFFEDFIYKLSYNIVIMYNHQKKGMNNK